MRSLPPDPAGPDNDLADLLDHYVQRDCRPGRARLRVRRARGPETVKDKVFGFTPGNGVHDIHMNQGNSARFKGDDGVWQDGGMLLHFPAPVALGGRLPAFQSQAWHTDDSTGHAIPGPAARPDPHPDAGEQVSVRILAAMVNPPGGDPVRETVTPDARLAAGVDLTGWRLADRLGHTCALPPARSTRAPRSTSRSTAGCSSPTRADPSPCSTRPA